MATTACTSAAAAALVAAALFLTVSPVFAADGAEDAAAARIKAAVCASNPTSELCVKDSFRPVGPQPRS